MLWVGERAWEKSKRGEGGCEGGVVKTRGGGQSHRVSAAGQQGECEFDLGCVPGELVGSVSSVPRGL